MLTGGRAIILIIAKSDDGILIRMEVLQFILIICKSSANSEFAIRNSENWGV